MSVVGVDDNHRTIYKGPRGGLYVLTATGKRAKPVVTMTPIGERAVYQYIGNLVGKGKHAPLSEQEVRTLGPSARSEYIFQIFSPQKSVPQLTRNEWLGYSYRVGRLVAYGIRRPLSPAELRKLDRGARGQYNRGVKKGRKAPIT